LPVLVVTWQPRPHRWEEGTASPEIDARGESAGRLTRHGQCDGSPRLHVQLQEEEVRSIGGRLDFFCGRGMEGRGRPIDESAKACPRGLDAAERLLLRSKLGDSRVPAVCCVAHGGLWAGAAQAHCY
jgi:hypothetical protein